MVTSTLILAAASAALALGAYYMFPEATERWFRRIARARKLLFGIFSVLVSFVLLGTGSPALMLMGAVVLILVVLGAIFDGPLEGV